MKYRDSITNIYNETGEYDDNDELQHVVLPNLKVIKVRDELLRAGPYRFFGTLTFQYNVTDRQAREFASKHWRKTQRELLGRNWIGRGVPHMTGITVMERAEIFNHDTRQFSNFHFHYLIHDHPILDRDDARAEAQLEAAFIEAARSLTHKNRRWQLVSKHGASVSRIWDPAGACSYVSKEAWNPWWCWETRILYLCRDGAL